MAPAVPTSCSLEPLGMWPPTAECRGDEASRDGEALLDLLWSPPAGGRLEAPQHGLEAAEALGVARGQGGPSHGGCRGGSPAAPRFQDFRPQTA